MPPGSDDILLVFPPLDFLFCYPELGMPRLVSHLRRRGFAAAQLDLNAELINHHLFAEGVFETVRRRIRSRLDRVPDHLLRAVPRERFLDSQVLGSDLVNTHAVVYLAFMEAYNCLVGTGGFDFDARRVAAAVERGDPLMEDFFARHLPDIERRAPAVVGLSMVSAAQVAPALLLSRMIRQRLPGVRIVWGGPWCTATTDHFQGFDLLWEHVDHLVTHQGEQALERLLLHLRGEGDLEDLPNLRGPGSAKTADTPNSGPRAEVSSPAVYDGLERGIAAARRLPVLISRGCYWGRCLFCNHVFPDTRYQERDPGQVVDEVARLARLHGVTEYELSCHSASHRLLGQIADELMRRGLQINWSAMIRADVRLERPYFERLRRSGCQALLFGLEHASQASLDRLRKGVRLDELSGCLRQAAASGVAVQVFVLNTPDQPLDQYRQTLEYVASLGRTVNGFIPHRFRYGRYMDLSEQPGLFGARLTADAPWDLRSFGLPYEQDGGVSEEDFFCTSLEYHQRMIRDQP